MDLFLKDKVALVTGGSIGLGKAICLSLAGEGAKVVVNYRTNEKKAQEVVEQVKEMGSDAIAIYADVSKEQDIMAMFEQVDEKYGMADILVNNAAYCPTAQVVDMSEETWNYTTQVNLTGTFLCCREFAKRLLKEERSGRIVNVSSQAALRGSTIGHAPYDASKGGLISFTISLARELCKRNIAVNCVAPGIMETDMMEEVLKKNRQKYENRIPLGRIGDPIEVADVVTFLSSERSSYMTGATVDVSAGMAMH